MPQPHEVKVDDRTVWIGTADVCLARLSFGIATVFPTPHTSETLIPGDWRRWVKRVREIHGIDLSDDLCPKWAR